MFVSDAVVDYLLCLFDVVVMSVVVVVVVADVVVYVVAVGGEFYWNHFTFVLGFHENAF